MPNAQPPQNLPGVEDILVGVDPTAPKGSVPQYPGMSAASRAAAPAPVAPPPVQPYPPQPQMPPQVPSQSPVAPPQYVPQPSQAPIQTPMMPQQPPSFSGGGIPPAAVSMEELEGKSFPWKKALLWILAVIVVALIIGGGAALAYRYLFGGSQTPPAPVSATVPTVPAPVPSTATQTSLEPTVDNQSPPSANNLQPINPSTQPPAPVAPAEPQAGPVDTDGDGVADADEARLGTDPKRVDTDNDGLFDGDEVKIYGTDPLNPDTDGDGYKDGEEVRNGYNPKGPGRGIFQIPPAP